MSKYTITIKNLIDNNFDFQMTSYPIWDEEYRNVLNTKILNHYYMNEIGFETAPLFRFYLNNMLNEIMPYYNEIYLAQQEALQHIFENVNITEEYDRTSEVEAEGSSESIVTPDLYHEHNVIFEDTPQGSLASAPIGSLNYATNRTVEENKNTGTNTNNTSTDGNTNTTENYIKTIIGKNGGKYSFDIFKDVIQNYKNIDLEIINQLNPLFMGIF